MTRIRLFVQFASVLLVLAAIPVIAADPASGTLSPATPTLTFTSGPHFLSNGGDCTVNPCDDFALKVELPANYVDTNPGATIEADLVYDIPGDLDLYLLKQDGTEVDGSEELPATPEHVEVAAGSGTQNFILRVSPFVVAGASATITVKLVNAPPPPPVPSGLAPRFQVHVPPPALGNDAGEPSVGFNKFTQRAMFISFTQALRLTFQENATPALPVACDAVWEDKSGTLTTLNSLDPILFTDETTGRTFNSQLSGANSLFEFTDDDGDNWSPGQIGVPNGGADHQSVATGIYPAGLEPPTASWPATGVKRAVYYCSQSTAAAFCSRSDDGGETFGPGFVLKDPDCSVGSLQGHVKVAPDGTAYVPDASQCIAAVGPTAEKVVAFVSENAGLTWDARPIPSSVGGAASDPSVGIATDGTVYMCYENADSHPHMAVSKDKGLTWINDTDIGAAEAIVYSRFPQSVAGDPDRASCAFLGTKTSDGDPNALDFKGVWYPYMATTYDGGLSYHLVNAAPTDPVQGHGGVGPSGTNRNLLDFNDLQIDDKGRTYFGLADGCTGGCVKDPSKNSFAAKATVIRQTGGRTLFKAFDDIPDPRFNSMLAIKPAPACASQAKSLRTVVRSKVVWNAPDTGGSPITNYQVYRATSAAGSFTFIGNAGTRTQYLDGGVSPSVPEYFYRVIAENAKGAAPVSNTIVLPISVAPPEIDTCSLPGDVIAVDATGDAQGGDDMDIVYLAVAEPPGFANAFVITMKIANFTAGLPAPSSFYPILFPSNGNQYIALDSTQGPAKFTYGTYEDVAQGFLAFSEDGLLDDRSAAAADGTITMVVPRAFFGNPVAGAVIAGFDARARIGAQSANSRDTAGPADYTVRGTANCGVDPIVLAALTATPLSGNAPLNVTFTVTGTPPFGKEMLKFTLDFGDQTSLQNEPFGGQTSVQVTHTYHSSGTYRARLTVTDEDGRMSGNLAEATIDVIGEVLRIVGISPTSVCAGGPAFTLTVNGTGFVQSSKILVGGVERSTTFVSSTQLTASVPASDIAASGDLPISVANPLSSTSNAVVLKVVTDATAPSVQPPAAISILQSTCSGSQGGATAATSSALQSFLNGAIGTDTCSGVTRLASQRNGQDVNDSTLFGGGSNTVTFRYRDGSGNIGTATSTVTIRLFGDLNTQNTVDATDAVILANYLVDNLTPGTAPFTAELTMADLNRDGKVDSIDNVILQNHLVDNIACLPFTN